MSGKIKTESTGDSDCVDDAVDPRVQIELERLNTATDDINKLEVDLDDARATFRELLCESTLKIDSLAKKLGVCIEKSRPYYDARFRAKEALSETQKAAVRFERANSQHAAAKEMVYLAEEGLRTEGRSFDHAWQEMLNHATSRVNESEHERAVSEVEHRRTTGLYHKCEHEVQLLQKELKRAITKSRPYYETKAHFHRILEEQKRKVTALEKSVGDAKMTYAQALRNLERISDEIHRTRQDKNAAISTNSSSTTESPDSTDYTSDEYLRLPEKITSNSAYPTTSKLEKDVSSDLFLSCLNYSSTEPRKYIKKDRPRSFAATDTKHIPSMKSSLSVSHHTNLSNATSDLETQKVRSPENGGGSEKVEKNEEWSEISLNNSPEEYFRNEECFSDEEEQIPYKLLPAELSPEKRNAIAVKEQRRKLVTQKSLPTMLPRSNDEEKKSQVSGSPSSKKKGKLESGSSIATWISRNSNVCNVIGESSAGSSANSSRRQSLDVLWSAGTGERVKEILNQGIMMLNISNLTERRFSDTRTLDKTKSDKPESKGKKIPSPLEKSLNYLNADDETSDSESLASVEMLTEDQITSLMMEPDINQVCQEVLGTPLVEVCPLLHQLQQQ